MRCGYLHSRHTIKRENGEKNIRAAIQLEKTASPQQIWGLLHLPGSVI